MSPFNRLRQALAGNQNQAEVDPHDWQLPSSYSTSKPGGRHTVIPDPKIFANVSTPSEPLVVDEETVLLYPDVSHAAVHLSLLECFRNLRLSADALDVEVHYPPAYEEKSKPAAVASSAAQRLPESQRWDLLIRLATARFVAWWSNIDRVLNHASAYGHRGGDKVAVQLAKEYLPPLDVLLVWYAFMLDSDSYSAVSAAREGDVPGLQHLRFPWPAIREAIDMEKMQFNLPRSAQNLFSTLSGQSADILVYLKSPPAYTDADALPFGLDLFAEVKKHEQFIDETHNLLWIRSPSVTGSLSRAAMEYFAYQLRGADSEPMMQDITFGVDLLWRTHRLLPAHYAIFMGAITDGGQGSDPKATMSENNEFDSDVKDTKSNSKNCLCWTCERIRDDLPTYNRGETAHTVSYCKTSAPTHSDISSLSSEQFHQMQDDLGFYKATETARQRGKPLPTRPPSVAEKETGRIAKEKQKALGYLPDLDEYIEVLPDGTRKIRKRKHASRWNGLAWTV